MYTKTPPLKSIAIQAIGAALLLSQLSACVPLVVGGAAAGGSVAIDRRTAGTYVEDQNIELKSEKAIADQLGDKVHANVVSYNFVALLTGEAYDEASKAKAESIVKSTINVKTVINEMIVGPKSDLSSRSNDAFITSKVKANMVNDARLSANDIKVFTERSVVYLMGIVSHKEAEYAVEIARSTTDVEKVVKVFEYLD